MAQGRKNTPTLVTELRGNPGKRPLPEEIYVERNIGDAPAWFNSEQLAAWNHIIDNAPEGLIKFIDESTLIAHCCAVAQHKEATLMIGREGAVVEASQGGTKKSDWFNVQAKCVEQIIKTSSEMGLTPASRSKVAASKGKSANKFSGNGKRAASA